MISKKVIVCDLDGTLAPSKSPLSREMAEVITRLLSRHYLAVVSGGAFSQFEKQFLSQLPSNPEVFKNLSLFPTMGSTCYTYDAEHSTWKQMYDEPLTLEERKKIIAALNEVISHSPLNLSEPYGDIIEDRGSQVTFSGRGQAAPIDVKEIWDPDQLKRRALMEALQKIIPEFEIRIGGSTSIDITKKGLDKAYAIGKIKELLHVTDDDIIFVGDALYVGGNDAPVKKTDVDYVQESGPEETIELLRQYL